MNYKYKLKFLPTALKEWKKLDSFIQEQLKTKLRERLQNPHVPASRLHGFENHYKIKLRPQVAGYCTWYDDKHSGAGDEKSFVELATFVAKELKPYGFSVVQIDDGWQDGGVFNGPARGFDRVRPDGPYRRGGPCMEQPGPGWKITRAFRFRSL